MRAIARGAAVGAALGASKGMVDLHQVRHGLDPSLANMYVDKVTPPPTYIHAAADQGVVGALMGGGFVATALLSEEYERHWAATQALRRGVNRAGRRDRASHDHDALHRPARPGRASSATNTAHLLNDEDAGG